MTKLTKQDVIGWLADITDKHGFYTQSFIERRDATIEMLKAVPDPKPDFYVGWKGVDDDGDRCEILAIVEGVMIGLVMVDDVAVATSWTLSGGKSNDQASHPLIPNTPPEPEPEWGPWIGWNGGHPPVRAEQEIEIMQGNGNRKMIRGRDIRWQHPDNSMWSVIAYRVKQTPPAPEIK